LDIQYDWQERDHDLIRYLFEEEIKTEEGYASLKLLEKWDNETEESKNKLKFLSRGYRDLEALKSTIKA